MRALLLSASICLLGLLAACQSTPVPRDLGELATRISTGERVPVADLQLALAHAPDLGERFGRLQDLEEQALALMVDEPLKLGAIGTAILDEYYGSLAGHMAMIRFYEQVGSEEAAVPHREWQSRIIETIEKSAGTADEPYQVTGRAEANAHLLYRQLETVGGIYQSDEKNPLTLALIGNREGEAVTTSFYALAPMYAAMRARFPTEPENEDSAALAIIGILARESDGAAQTSVGAFLAARKRTEDAIGWLRAASRDGNIVANMLLAGIFRDQIRDAENDQARDAYKAEILDNYMHAITLGSTDAMYALAVLYLNEQFGKDNVAAGVPLLERAAALKHSDSLTYLGHLYSQGLHVKKDQGKALENFVQAAELGNPRASYAYARLLVSETDKIEPDKRILGWLETLAKADDAEAMVHLGNLNARGIGTRINPRRALRWYKAAIKVNPEDGNVVNEIAWTVTVTDIKGLNQPRYAKTVMDGLMEKDEEARQRPEYLDTWAAVHAANGEFERAVELQQEALSRAKAEKRDDVLEILDTHLKKFQAGEVIIERAP